MTKETKLKQELLTPSLPSLECWNYKYSLPHLDHEIVGFEPKALASILPKELTSLPTQWEIFQS